MRIVGSTRRRVSEGLDPSQLASSVDKISRNSAPRSSGAAVKDVGGEKEGSSSDTLADSSLQYRSISDIFPLLININPGVSSWR